MEQVSDKIKDLIFQACQELGLKIKLDQINLEHPANPDYGDYATNIAMKLAGPAKQKSFDLAKEICKQISSRVTNYKLLVAKMEALPPGFINFTLSKDYLVKQANQLLDVKKFKSKLAKFNKDKTMVIDYSAPNIAKPFGIGHLRSTNIGQAIYNLYSVLGWKTIGDNHLGDWGTQFGKIIYVIKNWWDQELEDLTISKMEQLYVKFHQEAEKNKELQEQGRIWFKKLEDGDKEAKKIWQLCVDVSLKEFDRIYDILGVKIDVAYGESFYHFNNWMDKVLKDLKKTKFLEKSQGALVVNIPGLKTPGMLVKSDGGTTYLLRDLATLKFRKQKWNPDLIVYEVGGEQKLYFKQVFYIAEKLGYLSGNKVVHLAHGLIRWSDGKFSTRKGKTIHMEEVINKAVKLAGGLGKDSTNTEKIAKAVGIGAIKFNDLKQEVEKDIVFDWDKVLSTDGYSGPYLQYSYARAKSVLEKADCRDQPWLIRGKDKPWLVPTKYELNPEEVSLLRVFSRFSEILIKSADNFAPHYLCQYLFDLAQKFNLFYQKHRILDSTVKGADLRPLRLGITKITANILKLGLEILGIEVLERM